MESRLVGPPVLAGQPADAARELQLGPQTSSMGILSHYEHHVNGMGTDGRRLTNTRYGVAARWFSTDRRGVMTPSMRRKRKWSK